MFIFVCVCVSVCVRLLGWRRVSSAVDFRRLPRTAHRGVSDSHKVNRFSQRHRSDTRLPFVVISDNSQVRLLFTPLQPSPSHVYHSFLSFPTYVCTCARALANIYCVSTCVHTIFQIHLWHVFSPCPPPGSDPYFDPVDRIIFNGSLSTHAQTTEFWRSLITQRKRVFVCERERIFKCNELFGARLREYKSHLIIITIILVVRNIRVSSSVQI